MTWAWGGVQVAETHGGVLEDAHEWNSIRQRSSSIDRELEMACSSALVMYQN